MNTKKTELTGAGLKIAALITMVIDHIGAVLLEPQISGGQVSGHALSLLTGWDVVLRSVGRLSFPLFIFLLMEGFRYTRSRGKYALRLGIFAVISEIPFDLAFNGKLFYWRYNNIFFTLLIGLLVIWGLDSLKKLKKPAVRILVEVLILIAGSAAAIVLHTDYNAGGVFAIASMYLFRDMKFMTVRGQKSTGENKPYFAFTISVIMLALTGNMTELFALFDLIFLWLYNGKRGHQIRYFFYIFYPAHLLALAGIAQLMGIR